MSYELVSTIDTDEPEPKEKLQIFYKISYIQGWYMKPKTIGLFSDEKDANKAFQKTIEEAEKFCKESSERIEKNEWNTERTYHENRYCVYCPPPITSITENYYTVATVGFTGYKKGRFFGENLVCQQWIYKAKIEIPFQ